MIITVSYSVANTPFTRWSWLDELARRALEERSTSWLDELAIWSFEWFNIANIHEAARRALVSQLDERSTSQLVEPASSCKRGITLRRTQLGANVAVWFY